MDRVGWGAWDQRGESEMETDGIGPNRMDGLNRLQERSCEPAGEIRDGRLDACVAKGASGAIRAGFVMMKQAAGQSENQENGQRHSQSRRPDMLGAVEIHRQPQILQRRRSITYSNRVNGLKLRPAATAAP
jgi:hypothetical protein